MHPSAEYIILIIKSIVKKVTTSLSETWKMSDNLMWIDEDVVCGLWTRVKRNNLGSSNNVYTLSGRRILQSILATDHYSGQHPPFILFTTSLHCLPPWYWRNKPAQQQLQARYTNSQHDSDRQPSDKIDKIGFPIPVYNAGYNKLNTVMVDWQFICVLIC